MPNWNESVWFSMLAGTALKSTVLMLAAWLAARLLRRHSASMRHVIWTATAAAVLLLPFFSKALPELRILPPVPAFVLQANAATGVAPSAKPVIPDVRTGLLNRTKPAVGARPDWRLSCLACWGEAALPGRWQRPAPRTGAGAASPTRPAG